MLRHRLQPVLSRRVGVALAIWGEPGIGKSHTAAALLSELPCRHASVPATVPMSTLAGLLPRVSRLPGWATTTLDSLAAGAALDRPRVTEAIAAALATSAPFVLLAEDLHEADEERGQLLLELAATVRRTKGVGLLVTSRTEPPEPFQSVRLEPQSQAQIIGLLAGAMGSDLPPEASDWIASWSAGNPLFALEYLRYLGRQGNLWSDGRAWHWRRPEPGAQPPTIEALIEHFLGDVLAEPATACVAVTKALLPSEAGSHATAQAAGLAPEAVRAATRELERRGVLSGGAFVHPLYREEVAGHAPPDLRRQIARRALEGADLKPAYAEALVAAAELPAASSVQVLSRAAGTARNANDAKTAARLLALASDHATGEQSGALALEAASLLSGRDYPRMLALAEKAAALLADPSEALLLQAGGLSIRGDHERMREVLDRLPPELKHGVAWLQRQVRLLHQAGRREELIAAWEASPHQDECDDATVFFVGWAYLHAGSPRAAADLIDRRLLTVANGEPISADLKELQASVAFYTGDNSAAEKAFTELLESTGIAAQLSPPNVANLLRNRAVARMQQANYLACLPDLEAALRIFEEVGHGLHHAGTLVMLSYAYEELGAYERAEEALTSALETVSRSGILHFMGGVLAQLADLYLEWPGRAHATLALRYALQASEATASQPDGVEGLTARYLLSRARTATGRATEGLELAERTVARATEAQIAEAILAAWFAKGLALEALGRRDDAELAFQTASNRAQELRLPLHHHRYGLEADRLAGDSARAAERREWFAARGLQHGVNLVERYFPPVTAAGVTGRTSTEIARLEVLGPMRLVTGHGAAQVRGRLRQALLLALVDARLSGRPDVDRLTLIETLYPSGDEIKASASLKQLISDLRKDLGTTIVGTTATGYALGDVATDAEEFLATGDTRLWRGAVGAGVAWELSGAVSDRLHATLVAATAPLLDSEPSEAARLAALLRDHDPYDAEYLRLQLQALSRAALPRALEDEYLRSRSLFAEVGEELPEAAATFLES
ncbi:MAG TPA: AAA family ATPase [Trueperaceae bacterium]